METNLNLGKEQNIKVLKGAALALSGAIFTILLEWGTQLNFGDSQLFMAAAISVACNFGLKQIQKYKEANL